tara:strand:+ start:160 stop:405 length:246 start_codon:yes stop_codon:yes gene_type:complete
MSIDYIGVKIKATTYGDFPDDVKEITHAEMQFSVPCDESKTKKFEKAKDNLLQAVIDMYALEDQHQVDVTIEYEYFGVNQW